MTSLALIAFGACVGILSGTLGIGGGIVLVPGLVFLFGTSQSEAQGTSLAVLSTPVVLFAAVVYYRNGSVQLPVVGCVALGFAIGAYGGAKMAPHLPFELLRGAFGLLLLYSGAQLIWDIAAPRPKAALPAGLAAVIAGIVLWLVRRRGGFRDAPQSPASEGEYHI